MRTLQEAVALSSDKVGRIWWKKAKGFFTKSQQLQNLMRESVSKR